MENHLNGTTTKIHNFCPGSVMYRKLLTIKSNPFIFICIIQLKHCYTTERKVPHGPRGLCEGNYKQACLNDGYDYG